MTMLNKSKNTTNSTVAEPQTQRPPILLYTDGSSRGNPGLGGYGVVLKCGKHTKEISEGFKTTTNNRMELLAIIKGLETIKWDNASIIITSDSKYVIEAVLKNWLEGWINKGFKKTKNPDLWLRFIKVFDNHIARGNSLDFNWVKGHAGHPENERCDTLAVEAATSTTEPLLTDRGYELKDEIEESMNYWVSSIKTRTGRMDCNMLLETINDFLD